MAPRPGLRHSPPCGMASRLLGASRWHSHLDDPVNSRACCFDITGESGPSARYRAAVVLLSSGCSSIELRRMGMKMVARPGAAPGVSSSQARRIAVFLARDVEIGGLCGHCSRDLPLDRRLLFVAELTGQFEMVGRVGNAPTMVRMDGCFTGSSRSLRD